jgi:hypothetical protein
MWRGRAGVAALLWIAFAVVVWNVVFDRVLVLAGRTYVHDAAVADTRQQPFLKIDDYMKPAVRRGLRLASWAGGGIAIAGLIAVKLASARDERRRISAATRSEPPRKM